MGAAEIKGIQSQHVMAQVKHYVGYDSDADNIFIDDQTLHEVYVAPFDAAVKAGVSSIMCSYNRLNGTFACGNEDTLTTILRDEIGFKGFVTSDWGAVHARRLHQCRSRHGDARRADAGLGLRRSLRSLIPSRCLRLRLPQRSEDMTSMFGGHIPEEPAPEPDNFGDFGVKLDSEKMPEALQGRHGHGSGHYPGRGPRALRDCALRIHGRAVTSMTSPRRRLRRTQRSSRRPAKMRPCC